MRSAGKHVQPTLTLRHGAPHPGDLREACVKVGLDAETRPLTPPCEAQVGEVREYAEAVAPSLQVDLERAIELVQHIVEPRAGIDAATGGTVPLHVGVEVHRPRVRCHRPLPSIAIGRHREGRRQAGHA